MPKFPARVHPILARKANTAVVIRRGPSKSVCTMLWNRNNDTFKLGQWLPHPMSERALLTEGLNSRWIPQRISSTRPSQRTTTPGADLRTRADASLAVASPIR
jgi:hypothetical protein